MQILLMARAKFKYLSHTADVEFVAYGKDYGEALENSALALLNVALDLKRINKAEGVMRSVAISEKAGTIENLVWFTLQDILSKRAAGYLNAFRFKVEKLTGGKAGFRLKGRLLYKKLSGDYTALDVKAVTAHGLKVSEYGRGYSINVIIDV